MTTSSSLLEHLDEAVAFVRARMDAANVKTPVLAVVAGSGLGALGALVTDAVRIPYGDIPHVYAPTVIGHSGELVIGTLGRLPVAVLSGRIHGYEGHSPDETVFNVRMVRRLGAERFLVTNAAGGIEPWLLPGTLCRITDHLNMTGKNPLTGPNIDALGTRFPDMSTAWCPRLGAALDRAAGKAGVVLRAGVYAMLNGPSYETPAEIRMLRVLGASLVGMSTVLEAIALVHMGANVAGLSVVTNHAAGVSPAALDHAEVAAIAKEAGPRLLVLVQAFADEIATEVGL